MSAAFRCLLSRRLFHFGVISNQTRYLSTRLTRTTRSTTPICDNGALLKCSMRNSLGLITTHSRYYCHQPIHHKTENNIVLNNRVINEIKLLCEQNKLTELLEVFKSNATLENAIGFINHIKHKGDVDFMNLGLQIYDVLKSSHITPSVDFLCELMFLCNKVKPEQTLQIFSTINNPTIKINRNLFSQLTFATYHTKNKTITKNLVDMLKNGVDFKPTIASCNNLLIVFDKVDDCMWLMDYMINNKIKIGKGCFIALISVSSKDQRNPTVSQCVNKIHEQLLKTPHKSDQEVINHLLQMYANIGNIKKSIEVFESVEQPDLILWTCIIGLCAKNGEPNKSIELYDKMIENNITPDEITFINILSAISNIGPNAIKMGEYIHQQITQRKLDSNVILINSLIQMYNKCGEPNKSIELYDEMIENNITPNEITFINILSAISNIGPNALEKGKKIHQQIIQHKLESDVILKTVLQKMYKNCDKH